VQQCWYVRTQALLDKDAIELAISNEVFTLLKRSNVGRFALLTSLLNRLGLNTDKPASLPLTPVYVLATSEVHTARILSPLVIRAVYVHRVRKKRSHVIFDYNSRLSWCIFIFFLPLETGMNTA